ncbi:MAG TPA: prepilin-type N-terminal cleavage/methylation domain-containing protein [Nevskiaceae bacterium]|nr:prepilin-type N-terminal cleavage/methylation domain-containing protein [Nevskiaceae bacterium]
MLSTRPLTLVSPARQQGLSLIELMIALVAGLLVIGAGVSMMTSTFGSNATTLKATRMNQDLRGVLNALSYDLARAGSWSVAGDVVLMSTNTDLVFSNDSGTVEATAYVRGGTSTKATFVAPLGDTVLEGRTLVVVAPNAAGTATRYNLTIEDVSDDRTLTLVIPSGVTLPTQTIRAGSWTVMNPFEPITLTGGNCILFSYDLDEDGVRDDNERFGYRLDGTEGAIEASTTATSCTAGAAWENFSDERLIAVTAFSIAQATTATATTNLLQSQVREYNLSLSGRLRSDTSSQRTLQNTVQVRNHSVR